MAETWGTIPANTNISVGSISTVSSGNTWGVKYLSTKNIGVLITNLTAETGAFFLKSIQRLKILKVYACVRASTNVEFNLFIHSNPTLAGNQVMTDNLIATTSGVNTTVFNNNIINADDWVFINIREVTGTPVILTVTIHCSIY